MEKVTNKEIKYLFNAENPEKIEGYNLYLHLCIMRLLDENRKMLKELLNKKCSCNQTRVNAVSNVKFDPSELNDNDILAGGKQL